MPRAGRAWPGGKSKINYHRSVRGDVSLFPKRNHHRVDLPATPSPGTNGSAHDGRPPHQQSASSLPPSTSARAWSCHPTCNCSARSGWPASSWTMLRCALAWRSRYFLFSSHGNLDRSAREWPAQARFWLEWGVEQFSPLAQPGWRTGRVFQSGRRKRE